VDITTDCTTRATDWTYSYDLLDRLNTAAGDSSNEGWAYDGNGNRKTETGSNPPTYTILGNSNRLSSITGTLNTTYATD
jgi:hypothetical protein